MKRSYNIAGYYTLPPIEWANRSYKWVLKYGPLVKLRLHPNIKELWFSLDRNETWWFKARIVDARYGSAWAKNYFRETRWLPVPVFDFTPPEGARLARETAIVPQMSPEEWFKVYYWETGLPRGDF